MAEAAMFSWLIGRLPVPKSRSLSFPMGALLVTSSVGEIAGPVIGHRLNGRALVETLATVILRIREVPCEGIPDPSTPTVAQMRPLSRLNLHPDHRELDSEKLQAWSIKPCLATAVVVHGDLFLTNLAFAANGELAAVLDVGQMQLGCPCMDVSLLSWSLEMLIGREDADQLLNMFGLNALHPEVRYHRLTYDLALQSAEPWAWLAEHYPGYKTRAR